MPGSGSQRRRRVIVAGFHGRFVLVQLLWLGGLMMLFAYLLFSPLVGSLLNSQGENQLDAADRFLLLHQTVWPLLLGLFAVMAAVVIRMSHAVAGPLYRFRRIFDQIAAGDLTVRVKLRRRDYLTEEAAELGRMIAALRDRVSRAQAAARASDAAGTIAVLSEFKTEAPIKPADATGVAATAPPSDDLPMTAAPDRARDPRGFTLVELLIVMWIITLLTGIAVPRYMGALDAARVVRAIGDIRAISGEIKIHQVMNGCLPSTLADIGRGGMNDPWGRPYVYNVFSLPGGHGGGGGGGGSCAACAGGCGTMGSARKDRRLVPINSDFDFYSVGKDGGSAPSLNAASSQDDVIRGSDGGFIGLGRDF